jgi:hypothetical protein
VSLEDTANGALEEANRGLKPTFLPAPTSPVHIPGLYVSGIYSRVHTALPSIPVFVMAVHMSALFLPLSSFIKFFFFFFKGFLEKWYIPQGGWDKAGRGRGEVSGMNGARRTWVKKGSKRTVAAR